MAMSTGGGSGVSAMPNVTPMIDVMLVLLVIFMIVIPSLISGFNAQPPQGVNLKSHPPEAPRSSSGSTARASTTCRSSRSATRRSTTGSRRSTTRARRTR